MDRELRVITSHAPELRAAADTPTYLDGYAAVFNSYSRNLGGFVEQIDPVAFRDTLARGGNVLGLVNHDPNMLLADLASGTLALAADETGLRYSMEMDPADPDAQRVMAKVAKKKMRGSSFAFRAIKDDWSQTEQGFPLRTLRAVELLDVSAVAMPAYPATESDGLAVALRSLATTVGAPVDRLVEAARSNKLAQFMGGTPASEGPGEQPSYPKRSQWAARFGVRPPAGH